MNHDESNPLPPTLLLPFNTAFLGGEYQPLKPGAAVPAAAPYWLLLRGASLVVRETGGEHRLPEGEPPPWCPPAADPLCVGIWRGRPLYARSLDKTVAIPEPYHIISFQGPDATLDEHLSTLAGIANQIITWELRSRYCGRCGALMERIPLTWGKCCPACRSEYFPHIHPCIIVLVKRGKEFLLARNAQWPAGRFSLVAGFLDVGESLEECVKREVMEETGVTVKNIRYLGSQNWPFPGQQMIGFLAEHAEGEPRPDGVEVVEARWFTAETMPPYPSNIRSISRWIMKNHCV
jgi:NAD+ diphosphatase